MSRADMCKRFDIVKINISQTQEHTNQVLVTVAGIHSFTHQITCTCIVIATLFFTTTSAISEIYYITAFCSFKPFWITKGYVCIETRFTINVHIRFSFTVSPVNLITDFSVFVRIIFLRKSFFRIILVIIDIQSVTSQKSIYDILRCILHAISAILRVTTFIISPLPVSRFMSSKYNFSMIAGHEQFAERQIRVKFSITAFCIVIKMINA